jgi:Schlafen, AlbA_2
MALFLKTIFDWDEQDIIYLNENRIIESPRLEYKQELHLKTQGERKEFAKDVSAFANSQGGYLVYGIKEKKQPDGSSLPDGLLPLTNGELPKLCEDILLSSILPKMRFDIHPIKIIGDAFYLVIYIPQSLDCHMVSLGSDNRFYIRRNFQAEKMTEHEVRGCYDKALRRREDLDSRFNKKQFASVVHEITEEAWLYMVSFPFISTPSLVDTRKHTVMEFGDNPDAYVCNRTLSFTNSPEGYEDVRISQNKVTAIAKIHRDGCIEVGKPFGAGKMSIPTKSIYDCLLSVLAFFGKTYSKIGYYGLLRIYFGLKNIKDTKIGIGGWHDPDELKGYPHAQFHFTVDVSVDELIQNSKGRAIELMDILCQSYGLSKFPQSLID